MKFIPQMNSNLLEMNKIVYRNFKMNQATRNTKKQKISK